MEELEKALVVIREECNKHNSCAYCPLRLKAEGGCGFNKTPDKWTLRSDLPNRSDRLFA